MEVNFKSRINFVNINEFKNKITNCHNFVPYGPDAPLCIYAHDFFTEEIRTCTAGGITDAQNRAIGFHILDSSSTEDAIEVIKNTLVNASNFNNARGLLIGGKSLQYRNYSLPIFKSIKEALSNKIQNLSIFEQHRDKFAESFYHYNLNNDTWTICTRYMRALFQDYIDIQTPEQLKNAFKYIKIADGDELFINKERVEL